MGPTRGCRRLGQGSGRESPKSDSEILIKSLIRKLEMAKRLNLCWLTYLIQAIFGPQKDLPSS